MPEWIPVAIALVVGAMILRLMLALIDREPPPRYRDPNLSERERDEDFWDRQW